MDHKNDRKDGVDPKLAAEFGRELDGDADATANWGEPYRASGKMHGGVTLVTPDDE